jgi:hypothetical protein
MKWNISFRKFFTAAAVVIFFLPPYGCITNQTKDPFFIIKVVDKNSQRGIPMVELKTLNAIKAYSDNEGYIALSEPDLMDLDLYFEIKSTGYKYPKDPTGRQGVTLTLTAGEDTTLVLQRVNIAERLYRITGSGKHIHSNKLKQSTAGQPPPITAGVLGQDSNLAIPYKGKIIWVWGDTFLPSTYQGNFSVAAAWTPIPGPVTWSPNNNIPLEYIIGENGLTRPMIQLNGPGYVWFDWLMTLHSDDGTEKLVAKYARVNAYFGNYERGIALFNDDKEIFEKVEEVDPWITQTHTCQHPAPVEVGVKDYYYLFDDFSFSRVKSDLAEITNPRAYEYFSCLTKDNHKNPSTKIDRNKNGEIQYMWKKDVLPFSYQDQEKLIASGDLKLEEGLIHTRDIITGKKVDIGRGSIAWNPFRHRWICIWGSQDIWFAEADTPVGPWVYARKVVAHKQFFYNPVHHSFLDQEDGRFIFFEGTFTKFFSNEAPIPRYDYNQLMYGLSLQNEDVILPVPIYLQDHEGTQVFSLRSDLINHSSNSFEIPFFALDRPVNDPSIVPIYSNLQEQLHKTPMNDTTPLFYAVRSQFDAVSKYQGRWEGKINYKSFDNFLAFQLSQENGKWEINTDRSTLNFSNLKIDSSYFSIDLDHEGDSYHLTGQMAFGRIEGKFTNKASKSNGTWEAELQDRRWWPSESPDLIPLYKYILPDGSVRFTTKILAGPVGEVFCKVWRNPTIITSFDYTAKQAGAK